MDCLGSVSCAEAWHCLHSLSNLGEVHENVFLHSEEGFKGPQTSSWEAPQLVFYPWVEKILQPIDVLLP